MILVSARLLPLVIVVVSHSGNQKSYTTLRWVTSEQTYFLSSKSICMFHRMLQIYQILISRNLLCVIQYLYAQNCVEKWFSAKVLTEKFNVEKSASFLLFKNINFLASWCRQSVWFNLYLSEVVLRMRESHDKEW